MGEHESLTDFYEWFLKSLISLIGLEVLSMVAFMFLSINEYIIYRIIFASIIIGFLFYAIYLCSTLLMIKKYGRK